MDLFAPMKNLLCEAFSFKRYKALPLPLAILVGIVLLPIWISALFIVGMYYIASLFLALVNYPVDALLRFVRNEAKEVNEVTQVFVYIIGFPVVVLFKVFAVLFTLFNYVLFFFASISFYVATLCGVKFDISMKGEERSLEAEPKNPAAIVKAIVFLILNAVNVLLVFVVLILFIISLFGGPTLPVAVILIYIAAGFYFISLVWLVVTFGTKFLDKAFKARPKKEKTPKEKTAEEKKEEVVDEVYHEESKELTKELMEETLEKVPEEPSIETEEPQEETEVNEEQIEEAPVEEQPVEEMVEEQPQEVQNEAPVEEYHEEENHDENPQEEPKEEKHFDFSSLDEYQQNRRPSDDYQAERLDDLEDDYDRR